MNAVGKDSAMSSRSRRLERGPSTTSPPRATGARSLRALLPAVIAAVAVLGIGLWAVVAFTAGDGSDAPSVSTSGGQTNGLPDFIATASQDVRDAYAYAADHGAQLAYIPCYCGCGGHSGHRNVRDCFIKHGSGAAITYEEHGSQCNICVGIVLDAKVMLERGDSLPMVRAAIDEAYSDVGPGTDTPLPPGMEE